MSTWYWYSCHIHKTTRVFYCPSYNHYSQRSRWTSFFNNSRRTLFKVLMSMLSQDDFLWDTVTCLFLDSVIFFFIWKRFVCLLRLDLLQKLSSQISQRLATDILKSIITNEQTTRTILAFIRQWHEHTLTRYLISSAVV